MIRMIAAAVLLLAPTMTLAGTTTTVIPQYNPNWGTVGRFTAPSICAGCHRASNLGSNPAIMRAPSPMDPSIPDPDGEDISPDAGWRVSIMGHSLDDPYFHSVVEDETTILSDEGSDLTPGDLEDTCTRCHAPIGRTHAKIQEMMVPDSAGLDKDPMTCTVPEGCYRITNPTADMDIVTAVEQDHARSGVSCTLCHQVVVDQMDINTFPTVNGAYTLDPVDLMGAMPTLYGPYAMPGIPNPTFADMAGYDVAEQPAIRQSELCGGCHNLVTSVVDVDTSMLTGDNFLEQATYLEWLNSDYATGGMTETHCQECHMKPPSETYATKIARSGAEDNDINNLADRSPFGTHRFPGGNTHTLAMLSANIADLGMDPALTTAEFDRQIQVVEEFLETAATLDLVSSNGSNAILIDATVTNLTGHKLPSGFPSRRVWIHLKVTDRLGDTIFESGLPDANGRLPKDAGIVASECVVKDKTDPMSFDNSVCFEPHRDLITDQTEVALYESVMADTNANITQILVLADSYLKDNRIPPAGFVEMGMAYEPETMSVLGMADANFNTAGSGQDTVTYQIDTTGLLGPYQITGRLLYQSIRPSFVEALETTGTRVTDFKTYYNNIPPPVEEIDTTNLQTFGDEVVFFDSMED